MLSGRVQGVWRRIPYVIPQRAKSSKKGGSPPRPKNETEIQTKNDAEITPGEAKFQQIISDMKNVQGHITADPARGKYAIEYPELRKQQEELDTYMREEAKRQIKELNERMDALRLDQIRGQPLSVQISYWMGSAEFTAFVLLCFLFTGLFSWFRYSLDAYYLQLECDQVEEFYREKVSALEDQILKINQSRALRKE